MEDPKLAKGLVERAVVRIITAGTAFDLDHGDGRGNRYLAAVVSHGGAWGLAYADVATGEFATTEVRGEGAETRLRNELRRLAPAELLVPEAAVREEAPQELTGEYARLSWMEGERPVLTSLPGLAYGADGAAGLLKDHFGTVSLAGFGCEGSSLAVGAAGAVLGYLQRTQRAALVHFTRLVTYAVDEYMVLDPATRRSLELYEAQRDGGRKGTLLWVLDQTVTAMGGRLLKEWVQRPLKGVEGIEQRLDAVEDLTREETRRRTLRQALEQVYDLERLVGRVGLGVANGRDLVALTRSLQNVPLVKETCRGVESGLLRRVGEELDPLGDLAGLLARALVDEPPVGIKDGGLIRSGYSAELDRLREASRSGKEWIAAQEANEREATGIKSLKIGFNKVFGYYLEVSRSNLALVPVDRYERRQTLVNAERFITPELKEYEALVLGAEDKMAGLEYELFVELREAVARSAARLQATARLLATADALASLAEVAVTGNYCRPRVTAGEALRIVEGRHPVVERTLPSGSFVPNDLELDAERRFLLVTGPNMAGKSTYLRQVALIVLMAQVGSFVPARAAEIGLVDRVFTRVGAADDLAGGQSTFMVEMTEVANILHHATRKSLIILDEVGRGTSTFDGLAIAWAVTEFIHDPERVGAKTLFATHYHELTRLAADLPGLANVSVAVRREGEDVVFLRRIVPGGADESYGIEVARLAGLPRPLLKRAQEVLSDLDRLEEEVQREAGRGQAGGRKARTVAARRHDSERRTGDQPLGQLPLFGAGEAATAFLERLSRLDISSTTPLAALNTLAGLVEEARQTLGAPQESQAEAAAGKAE
jgi:DNA mismatch repair protein MutS